MAIPSTLRCCLTRSPSNILATESSSYFAFLPYFSFSFFFCLPSSLFHYYTLDLFARAIFVSVSPLSFFLSLFVSFAIFLARFHVSPATRIDALSLELSLACRSLLYAHTRTLSLSRSLCFSLSLILFKFPLPSRFYLSLATLRWPLQSVTLSSALAGLCISTRAICADLILRVSNVDSIQRISTV